MKAMTQRSSAAAARALAGDGELPGRIGSDDGRARGRAPQGRGPYGRSGTASRSGGIGREQRTRDEGDDKALEGVGAPGAAVERSFLTGYEEIPDPVRVVRLDAFHRLTEPCEGERLDLAVASDTRNARAQRRLCDESTPQTRRCSPDSFIGHSAAARGVREILTRLTEVPLSALVLTGETGSGKGLVARILHHAGPRAEGPLVEVNCAALPRELLESELFGHEAGAFTGAKGRYRGLMEQANGGTLFLDEIGEMDLDLQSKLLKAIEDRALRRLGGERTIPTDIQLIAATNHDLQARVREGHFRADLYHRLTVFCLELPPLRRRKEDLEDLVPLYVAEFNVEAAKDVKAIPNEVWRRLHAHDWPGNVRELRNVVERCVLFATGTVFPAEWLQLGAAAAGPQATAEITGDQIRLPLDGSMALEDMDRHIIQTALERHCHNVTATARALRTTRETLRYRIQKYGLDKERRSEGAGGETESKSFRAADGGEVASAGSV